MAPYDCNGANSLALHVHNLVQMYSMGASKNRIHQLTRFQDYVRCAYWENALASFQPVQYFAQHCWHDYVSTCAHMHFFNRRFPWIVNLRPGLSPSIRSTALSEKILNSIFLNFELLLETWTHVDNVFPKTQIIQCNFLWRFNWALWSGLHAIDCHQDYKMQFAWGELTEDIKAKDTVEDKLQCEFILNIAWMNWRQKLVIHKITWHLKYFNKIVALF